MPLAPAKFVLPRYEKTWLMLPPLCIYYHRTFSTDVMRVRGFRNVMPVSSFPLFLISLWYMIIDMLLFRQFLKCAVLYYYTFKAVFMRVWWEMNIDIAPLITIGKKLICSKHFTKRMSHYSTLHVTPIILMIRLMAIFAQVDNCTGAFWLYQPLLPSALMHLLAHYYFRKIHALRYVAKCFQSMIFTH